MDQSVETSVKVVVLHNIYTSLYSTTYGGCSPQHIPTTYKGAYIVGVCCGEHYMLWVYVVGNTVKNGECAPQHIICCGEHVHVVDNIYEHVLHNIGTCYPQHVTHNICCPQHMCMLPTTYVVPYVVDNILWTTSIVLWGTYCGQHVPHNIMDVVHNMSSTTCNPQYIK